MFRRMLDSLLRYKGVRYEDSARNFCLWVSGAKGLELGVIGCAGFRDPATLRFRIAETLGFNMVEFPKFPGFFQGCGDIAQEGVGCGWGFGEFRYFPELSVVLVLLLNFQGARLPDFLHIWIRG